MPGGGGQKIFRPLSGGGSFFLTRLVGEGQKNLPLKFDPQNFLENNFSIQFTDQYKLAISKSNLPISLTYIVLFQVAVHLGDLLRIWVRAGTKFKPSPQDFQGPTGVHRTPREARCFTATTSLSPGKPIPGSPSLTKKRELFPGLPPASPGSFALPQ